MNTQRVEGHTPTLKPCPFCGEEPLTDYDQDPYVICQTAGCGMHASGGMMTLYEWNHRPSIERLEKVNEALVRYAEQVRDCKYVPDYVHEWSEAVLRLAKEPA